MSLNHFCDQELRNQIAPYLASPNIVVNSKINVVGTVPTPVPSSINVATVVRNSTGDYTVTYKTAVSIDATFQATAFDAFALVIASTTTDCQLRFYAYGGSLADPGSFSLLIIK